MKKILLSVCVVFLMSSNLFSQTPFSFGAKVGANIPIGTFSDVYKSGVSGEVVLYYSTPLPVLDLSLTVGYDGFKYKNDYFTNQISTNFPGVTVDNFSPSWTATDIPIMVGAKVKLPFVSMGPYFTGEVGIHFLSLNDRFMAGQINVSSSNPMHINTVGYSESKSVAGFGFALGAGLEIPLVPKIGIDIALKYNYATNTYANSYTIFRNNNEQFTTLELKNISYITAKAGVIVHL
ncbi:MAG: outer membrane beta-barrel protein [Ignavibacteria bacterium]|nr:outer membrane beta-barrel protein [Ignavibacteria bacterium]